MRARGAGAFLVITLERLVERFEDAANALERIADGLEHAGRAADALERIAAALEGMAGALEQETKAERLERERAPDEPVLRSPDETGYGA